MGWATWDWGRRSEIVLSLYATAAFAILWAGVAVALATRGDLLDRSWEWLRGLPPMMQALVWMLLLPIALGLCVWQTNPGGVGRPIVAVVLVGWTLVTISNLIGGLRGSARTGHRVSP